jgi:predicted RNase H-like nuclease (RuvC/YqgF family)
MPTYAQERKISKGKTVEDRDLAKENKRLKKLLSDEKEKVEILKKSLHIFMQPQE